MPVKISGLVKLKKDMKKIMPEAKSNFGIEMKRSIVDILVEKITSGISPVSGQNRYKKYANSTAKIKGRKEPVDLVGSGKMLENMKARQTKDGDIVIEFPKASERKKAQYHNSGTDKMPQRKIIPNGKEVFKQDIMNKIVSTLNKAISKALK